MITGTLGKVVFSISRKKVQTIKSMSWKKQYSYGTHKLYGKKTLLEFTGIEPDEIELEMEISAFLGVRPLKMIKSLASMADQHQAIPLVLGTDVIGTKWVITNIEPATDKFYMDGTLVSTKIKVKIKEYGG